MAHTVAFAEGTFNPVTQMGNPECFKLFTKEELEAIQWDSLDEEMAGSVEYDIVPDYDKLLDICDNILGRSFCALGDGATSPITSSIQYFRDEYIAHLTHGGCPFDPKASTLFAKDEKESVTA